VDDLEAVAFGEGGLGPFGARDDLTIVLDGDAVALQSELGDEAIQTRRLRESGKGTGLAVENKRERHDALSVAGVLSLVHGPGQSTCHPLAEAAVCLGDLLTLGEDSALEAHEDVDGIGVGLTWRLVDEEHAGVEQVVDGVAEDLDGEALLRAAAPTNDGCYRGHKVRDSSVAG